MENKARLDFETRSTTDIRTSGVHRYSEDPITSVWGFFWELNGELNEWRMGYSDPTPLLDHIMFGGLVEAHGAAFERTIWNTVIRRDPRYSHWPKLLIEQQDCTMARAAASGLPQDLDKLCAVLHSDQKKDKAGHVLMMKMCKPRRKNPDGTITWWDSPEEIDRLMEYCGQDVRAERGVDERIPQLTANEQAVWRLDQTINDRGIPIDLNAVRRCSMLVTHAKKEADREMRALTHSVPKCSNDGKIIAFLNSRGIECTTVKKEEKDNLLSAARLRGDTVVERVINLRAASKKTSTAKYNAMLKCVCEDERIRGLLNYHGAGTGRWVGRLVQPQNFPRFDIEDPIEEWNLRWLHDLLSDKSLSIKDVYEAIVMCMGQDAPMVLLSKALRSMFKASKGRKFIGGDFSNIEGRLNAWFANETWKLKAFREYDDGIGPDLYKVMASTIVGKRVDEISKSERQSVGKTTELACGYQGSVPALVSMCKQYNVNIFDISNVIEQTATAQQWDSVSIQYDSAPNKTDLQQKEWTALKICVDNWRLKNSSIVQSWWDYQDAAIAAVSSPGSIHSCCNGKVRYHYDGQCLWCVIPSSRMICYVSPRLKETMVEYVDKNTGETKERMKKSVSFMGYKEGRWTELFLYGGLQCENIVSGTARDVMVDKMFAAEHANYPVILTVHDELLTEPLDDPYYNEKVLESIMSVVPDFVKGLPLATKAWEDMRYIK